MSRYIDADELEKRRIDYIVDGYADSVDDMVEWGMAIIDAPSIDLDDYVPKEFHDKTCEAMAKRHQEEIADMVSVVRCKECKHCNEWEHPNGIELYCNNPNVDPFDWGGSISFYVRADDYCSWGEREGE